MDELQALREENKRLRIEVQRWRGAFELSTGRKRPQGEGICSIEARYPHITAKLIAYWGGKQLLPYLNSLLIDDRGDREGFSFDALLEMQLLKELHLDVFPHHPDWTDNYMR